MLEKIGLNLKQNGELTPRQMQIMNTLFVDPEFDHRSNLNTTLLAIKAGNNINFFIKDGSIYLIPEEHTVPAKSGGNGQDEIAFFGSFRLGKKNFSHSKKLFFEYDHSADSTDNAEDLKIAVRERIKLFLKNQNIEVE